MQNEVANARKDMSALMVAVLTEDQAAFNAMLGMLDPDETKAIIAATMGFLSEAVRAFSNGSKGEPISPVEFWLEAMQQTHPEE